MSQTARADIVPNYNRAETSGSQFRDERKEIMGGIARNAGKMKITGLVGIAGIAGIEVALNARLARMAV